MDRLRQLQVMLAALAVAVLLSGCGVVLTHPLPPSELEPEERALIEGSWLVYGFGENRMPYTIRFTCNGMAEATTLSSRSGEQLYLEQWQITVTKGKKDQLGQGFLTVLGPGPVMPPKGNEMLGNYLLFRYQFEARDLLVLWRPKTNTFDEAIMLRRLSGEISVEETVVTSDPQVLLDFMGDPDDLSDPELFEHKNPLILRKVDSAHNTEPLKPCGKP